MPTFAALKRLLLRRVETIAQVALTYIGPFQIRISVKPSHGVAFADVKERTQEILARYGALGVSYKVVELEENTTTESPRTGQAVLRLAAFASDQTLAGIRQSLVKAIPSLGRATFHEVPGKSVEVRVCRSDRAERNPTGLIIDPRDEIARIGKP